MSRGIFFVSIALVISMSVAGEDSKLPELPMEQLGKDQDYVTETVETLAQVIAPNMPWRGAGGTRECLAKHDRIRGYKTRQSLDLSSRNVGHDIDDATAIDNARGWLSDQGYKFIEDVQFDDGLRRISAVREDEADGIGVSVSAHPGHLGITGTTKCRP